MGWDVEFTVYGEPASKERPRFSRSGHAYTPAKTREAEKTVLEAFQRLSNAITFDVPVELRVELYLGSKRRKDADNMAKLVQDALNGHAFTDDYLIYELSVSKRFVLSEAARTKIYIRRVVED